MAHRWLCLLLLSACGGETGFHRDVDVGATPGPEIDVQPLDLEFGPLNPGQDQVRAFTIRNIGDQALHLADVLLEGDASFSLLTGVADTSLLPEETLVVDVLFEPLYIEALGSVTVHSDDLDEPVVTVSLLGTANVPQLEISPNPVEFGEVAIACELRANVTLTNVGTRDLRLDDATVSGDAFTMVEGLPGTVLLAPGESTPVKIDFAATSTTLSEGSLDVASSDARGIVSAPLIGLGFYERTGEATLSVPKDTPVDILFAIDQSCSMGPSQVALAFAFGEFIARIEEGTANWQLGVVTEDDGCFSQGVITPTTPNYADVFANAVSGTGGSLTESLLALSAAAIDQSDGCNAGFLRPDTALSVIVVSDEKEQSGVDWSVWVDAMTAHLTDAEDLVISGIVDLYEVCGDPFNIGAAGYTEAATATGGLLLDICDTTWVDSVRELAGVSLEDFQTLALDDDVDPNSLHVTVDGVEFSDWEYDNLPPRIDFPTPWEGGEQIVVTWGHLSDCR